MKIGENQYDLIISDISMPKLDGYNLLKIMKSQKIEIPVIYLTVNISAEDEIKGLSMGAVDYIKKPVISDLLKLKVKKILGE
jgi:DNA-binding response OmpR family regulator